MAGPSYRLQAPRPRQAPPPLNFDSTTFRPTSTVSSHRDSQTLLYDLPSATISPPNSRPQSARTPTSPTFTARSPIRNGRPTPPPGAQKRSQTPIGIAPNDLEKFVEQCRAWYYNQDEQAGRSMTQTLAALPPSHRAPFSRVQSSIREAYHRSVSARRHAELQAHLSLIQPGGSLSAHLRPDPRSKEAQKERYEHMERFINNWCTMGLPGTKPFFEALWAILRLQVIPETLGGAGRNRIEWEFDDAVLKEAAGKNFMLEAVEILKGVLAFEEQPSSKHFSAGYSSSKFSNLSPVHSRSQSQPLSSDPKQLPIPSSNSYSKRSRAPSDPFLDTPAPSRSVGTSSSNLSSATTTTGISEPLTPTIGFDDVSTPLRFENASENDIEEEYMRVWTSPDLTDPELLQLLNLFPAFVSRRALPRFPVSTASRPADIEEGEDADESLRVRFGTGSMWNLNPSASSFAQLRRAAEALKSVDDHDGPLCLIPLSSSLEIPSSLDPVFPGKYTQSKVNSIAPIPASPRCICQGNIYWSFSRALFSWLLFPYFRVQ
ncbi:hypothetical protein NP233_g10639 [Leucocoprinus birnbaumii]|uniref:Uncharacterized protein n=1 Tax=Leucocoprinus birnbaumii TaxID=56174 RepID=A0AAD5VLL1_9AGAR|nr:hypothetical protein NP233_g10639 [Leucocoprinus birnbaumii]